VALWAILVSLACHCMVYIIGISHVRVCWGDGAAAIDWNERIGEITVLLW